MLRIALVLPLAIVLASDLAYATEFAYQGRLEDAATGPLNDPHDFQFTLWGNTVGAPGTFAEVWSEDQLNVDVVGGVFSVLLGSQNPIPAYLWSDHPTLELAIAVRANGETNWVPLQNRQKIAYVPRAVQARSFTGCEVVTSSGNSVLNNTVFEFYAPCGTGQKVLTGGFSGDRVNSLFFTRSYPDVANERWAVGGRNASGSTRTITVYAICCD